MSAGASRYSTSDSTSPAGGPARRLRLASYKWRRVRRPGSSRARAFRTALWFLTYLGLSGLLVWVALWLWPPNPASLVLVGAGYETNLAVPQNVYGRAGLDGFRNLARDGPFGRPGRLGLAWGPRTVRKRDPWDRGLTALPGQTALVVLAMHGGVDAKGPFLLPDDADADPEGNNRVRLEAVLDRFEREPFRSKNVVLVLDATRLTAAWPLGMLRNDFARALDGLNDRIARNPNLIIMSASGVGQRSWVSDEWRESVFAHFLIEGLQGKAAGEDGRVNAAGLFDFASRQVATWVETHRGAFQEPVLFPRGREGGARAARMELVVARLDDVPKSTATESATAAVSPEWQTAWATYERLGHQSPSPAAHAPTLWTRYIATLLRFDELERAGEQGSSRIMLRRLGEIERDIGDMRELTLGSAQNTLAMPAVEGKALPGPTEADILRFNALRGVAPNEAARRWTQLQNGPGAPAPGELRLLRRRLDDMLLTRFADDLTFNRIVGNTADELTRVVAVLKAIEDPSVPRPAEVHELVMIERDRPRVASAAYDKALGLAIQTRRLAERTAAALPTEIKAGADPFESSRGVNTHSARVFPWIKGPLARADQERRLGTDLLFSSEPADWDRARDHLESASSAYQQITGAAGVVREALAIHNEVRPVLPGYSTWLVRWGSDEDRARGERLWDDLHALSRAIELDPPDFQSIHQAPAPSADDPHPLSLAERAERVRDGFEALVRQFAASCDKAQRGDSPEAWGVLDDALKVPFLDFPIAVKNEFPELSSQEEEPRFRLIEALRTIGPRVLPRPTTRPAAPAILAETEARREARLALATLGRVWFETNAELESPTFDQSRGPDGPTPEMIGPRVGERLRAIPTELVRVLHATRPAVRIEEIAFALREVDRLARMLDGAGAEVLNRHTQPIHLPGALAPTISRERLSGFRRHQTRTFLLAQAERALDDHWAAEGDDAPRPYYASAGLTYLADADALDTARLWPEGPLAEMKGRLTRPDRLALEGPTQYAWTSERQVDFSYSVRSEPEAAPRDGFPVLWVSPAEGLKTTSPPTETRFAFRLGPGLIPRLPTRLEDPLSITISSASEDDARREATSTAHGLFRGQKFDRTTRIDLHRTPEIVAARQPRPSTARVSVRAEDPVFERSGLSRGAVAVVLDASGSMGPPEGVAFSESTRYAQATRGLGKILREMPAGTTVSLYIFGAEVPGSRDIPAEQTIRTVRPPTRWDVSQLPALMAQITYPNVVPYNDSPIVRTMIRARDDLLRLSDVGLRTIVVVTDGDDNRFEVDPLRGASGKDISSFLRESFKDAGIQINIVALPQTKPELIKKLQDQFKVILELPVPGRFYDANQPIDLVTSLRTVFRQELTYRVVREDRAPLSGISALDVTVSRLDADDIWCPWPLPPGGYRLLTRGEKPLEARVALDGGDLLLVTLGERNSAPTLSRGLFAQEFYPNQPSQTDRAFRWRLSALQNQLFENRALRILATLERMPEASEGTLHLPRPREVWFEVAPGDDTKTGSPLVVRWTNREGYPAPAWSLEAPDWPRTLGTDEPARPTLRAWWREELSSPAGDTLNEVKPIDVRLPVDADRTIELPGGTVILRGVQVEEHNVEVSQGERRWMPCLVVRLAYPKGKPVWVRPRGVNATGWEHRFYTTADSYTGLFWTTTIDQALTTVNRLDLISLDTFKRTCEGEGGYIELPLDAPRGGSMAPPPFNEQRAQAIPPPRPPAPATGRGLRR